MRGKYGLDSGDANIINKIITRFVVFNVLPTDAILSPISRL